MAYCMNMQILKREVTRLGRKGDRAFQNAFCIFQMFFSLLSKWMDIELLSREQISLPAYFSFSLHLYLQEESECWRVLKHYWKAAQIPSPYHGLIH